MLSFDDWLDFMFYPGFSIACSGLTDEEFWELEDAYVEYYRNAYREVNNALGI